MGQLFQRVCKVQIGTAPTIIGQTANTTTTQIAVKNIEGFKTTFKIVKTLTKEPNTADIKIYNLSEQSRSAMQTKGVPVVLTAGYQDNAAVIFSGDARTIDHLREGPDWVTHIQCGDGERAYRFARVQQSFQPGVQLPDVVIAVAKKLGINLGNLPDQLAKGIPSNLTQYPNGYTAHGKASVEFDRLMKAAGFTWSMQGGALQVLAPGDSVGAAQEAVLLTPNTGLIGSPDHGNPDIKNRFSILKARSLLQPQIRCGGKVRIQASKINGLFYVQRLEITGDTEGGEWYSGIEALAISG